MEIKEINKFLMHYRKSIWTPSGNESTIDNLFTSSLLGELMQYGYTLDGELIKVLKTKDLKSAKLFAKEIMELVSELKGDYIQYEPMFKNFPNYVESNKEIFNKINKLIKNEDKLKDSSLMNCGHLISKEKIKGICSICELVNEANLINKDSTFYDEYTNLIVIKYAKYNELYSIFNNLLKGKNKLSRMDKLFIETMILHEKDSIIKYIPENILMKENLVFLVGLLIDNDIKYNVIPLFKTSTDVLRLAVYLSSRQVNLDNKIKFKLKRKDRKLILSLIESIKNPEEDLLRYKEKWKVLSHCLHIGEFSKKFPLAYKVLDSLRNNKIEVKSFESKINTLINEPEKLLNLLSKREGYFLRKLDFLLRNYSSQEVLKTFNLVIAKIPTLNLLKFKKFVKNRNKKMNNRFFILKKQGLIKFLEEDSRKVLSQDVIDNTINLIDNELISRFKKEEIWESVYLDDSLKNILLPLVNNESNYSLMNITKGSSIPLEEKNYIRMFCYWHETELSGEMVDLDLSVEGFSSDFNRLATVSFRNLNDYGAIHSGDIRSAPKGASEFVDVPVKIWKDLGVRYVVMNLHSFSSQKFSTFDASAGFILLDEPLKNDIYNAKLVKNRFNVINDSKINIPLLIDIDKMEMIWIDSPIRTGKRSLSVGNTQNEIVDVIRCSLQLKELYPSLYDLFELHAQARSKNIISKSDLNKKPFIRLDMEMKDKMDDIVVNYLK